MKKLKNVKTGDIIDTSIKDRLFIKTCFAPAVVAERSAKRFMSQALEDADTAWKNIKVRWPELIDFNFTIDHVNNCIIIKEKLSDHHKKWRNPG